LHLPGNSMQTAPELLRAYLANIQSPEVAAALFSPNGVLELPWVKARVKGPHAIEGLIAGLLTKMPTFSFKNIKFWIETPERTFAEYEVEAPLPATGKIYRQTYAGLLIAEHGKITLLREALDTVAASEAMKNA
jgi:ketosteroid isomerase-like protein